MAYWFHTKKIDKHLVGLLYYVKDISLVKLFFNIAYVREVFKWVIIGFFIFELLNYRLISALKRI